MSSDSVGYGYPLIGYSWDSNTSIDINGNGWNIAKSIAKDNGPKMAQFLLDLKDYCFQHNNNDIKIRTIAHSLGARVVLSAIDSSNNNIEWRSSGFKIATVNLLGGAVDNYEVLKGTTPFGDDDIKKYYGNAIENQILHFFNMYSSEDDVLEPKYFTSEWDEPQYYPSYEDGNAAIGQNPLSEQTPSMPHNYKNVDVEDDLLFIKDADNDKNNNDDGCDLPNTYPWRYGSCTINGVGDNHLGYIGFRDPNNQLMDEGAIDKVAISWTSP